MVNFLTTANDPSPNSSSLANLLLPLLLLVEEVEVLVEDGELICKLSTETVIKNCPITT